MSSRGAGRDPGPFLACRIGGFAFDVNDRSQIVGQSETGFIDPETFVEVIRAFFWFGGTMMDLGTLGGSELSAGADGISDPGQIAGASDTPEGVQHAVIWTVAIRNSAQASRTVRSMLSPAVVD